MVNKETMLDRERMYPQPSFESYTLALAATAEADLASFLYQEGEEMPDFEHDITLWMKGVNLGEEAGDISARIETKQGRGRTYTLNTDTFDTGDGVLDESTPDGILTALAVTKAKLLAVRPLMEEIYPALSWEADEYIKYLDQAAENIISPKQDKRGGRRVHYSLKDTLSDLFAGSPASRRYAGLSLLVLTSLVLASCKPVEATSTVTPDVEPTRARVTEVTSVPTEVITQVTPQNTPSPTVHMVTPTEDTRTKTPTITVMPTVTVSPEAPLTPEYTVGELPPTLEECSINTLHMDTLDEDLVKLNQAEHDIPLFENVIGPNMWENVGQQGDATSLRSPLFITSPTPEDNTILRNCAMLEIDGNHPIYIFSVPIITRAGNKFIAHFGVDAVSIVNQAWEFDFNGTNGLVERVSPYTNYELIRNNPTSLITAVIYGGEILPPDSYFDSKDASQESTRQIFQHALDNGYLQAIDNVLRGVDTEEDIEILKKVIIPSIGIVRDG